MVSVVEYFIFVMVFGYCMAGDSQHICVSGTLRCTRERNDPLISRVALQLVDVDRFNADDVMGDAVSDHWGNFEVCGRASDLFGMIEPEVRITHQCRTEPNCKRTIKIRANLEYIDANSVQDMGTIDLGDWENQRKECEEVVTED